MSYAYTLVHYFVPETPKETFICVLHDLYNKIASCDPNFEVVEEDLELLKSMITNYNHNDIEYWILLFAVNILYLYMATTEVNDNFSDFENYYGSISDIIRDKRRMNEHNFSEMEFDEILTYIYFIKSLHFIPSGKKALHISGFIMIAEDLLDFMFLQPKTLPSSSSLIVPLISNFGEERFKKIENILRG